MLIKGKFGKRAKGKCRRFKTSKELKWKKNHNYNNKKKYQRSGWDKCKEERKNGRKKKTEKKRNKRE